jgi:Ca2+-binding RTX toxin-like protein
MVRTRRYLAVFTVMAAMALMLMLPDLASATPANDNFVDAQTISGQTASVDGTNLGATLERRDPSWVDGYLPTSHTVWYRWTAPYSGLARIDTCTSDFDTILGVYTGSTLGSLTEKAGNDDACGTGSKVTFNVTENRTYHILVDGFYDSEGTFTLGVSRIYIIDCRGGQAVCEGTDRHERITGTRAKDTIKAYGGEDEIYARGGNDVAIGGGGDDVMDGNNGPDRLYGGDGDDVIYTGDLDEDRDSVTCGAGQDSVWRERRMDTVSADCEYVNDYSSGGGGGGY